MFELMLINFRWFVAIALLAVAAHCAMPPKKGSKEPKWMRPIDYAVALWFMVAAYQTVLYGVP